MSLLIVLEGLDGVGKSTLTKTVVNAMEGDPAFYKWIYASKEPGSQWTGTGPELRKMVLDTPDFSPLERELMFYVDASLHAKFINNQGQAIIVSDRGKWSHLAYLRGYLKTKQIDYEQYVLCRKLIDKVCFEPDCFVYLKGDLALMQERMGHREKDAIEKNSPEFFAAVLETYDSLVQDAEFRGIPILKLDARDNLDKNTKSVIDYLKEVFDAGQLKNGDREVCGV